MKRLAYTFIYIALAGFITTTIANLLHKPGVAMFMVIISCASLVMAGIIALFYKLNNSKASNMQTSGKRNVVNLILRFSAAALMIIGLIMILQRMLQTGMTFFIIGCFVSLLGSIHKANSRTDNLLTPALSRPSMILMYMAVSLVGLGLVFKMQHYPGGEIMILTGLTLFLVYCILLLYRIMVSSSEKTPRFTKVVNMVLCVSMSVCVFGLIISILHMHKVGQQLITFSLIGIICSIIMNIFTPNKINRIIINPIITRNNLALKTAANIGLIFFILSLVLKINHYSGLAYQYIFITGIILLLITIITTNYLRKKRYLPTSIIKKYPILNNTFSDISTSEPDSYVGTYYNEQLKINITLTKNDTDTELIAQANDQKPFLLTAVDKNIFNYDPDGIIIDFAPGKQEFILIQRRGYFPFIRNS